MSSMCFDDGARPPLPPMRGGAIDARDLMLTSRDGTAVPAHGVRAERTGGPGIVVIPDVRGLLPYYEELARQFAGAGVHAVTLDLYARSAGSERRVPGWEHGPHVTRIDPARVDDDVAAAVAHLRAAEGGGAERIFTVGFCMGGRVSLLQAAAGLSLDGVIGLYPWPTGDHRSGLPAPADEAPRFGCPVLTLYGGDDPGIPAESRDTFAAALRLAGIEHRSVVYDGAPHSFFDRREEHHAEASADAWRQMLAFMGVEPETGA